MKTHQTITIGHGEQGALAIDIPRLLVSRVLITSSSGGGKSWLLRKLLEQVSLSTQTFVFDPESEFASLREIRDMVLIGPDGDLPPHQDSAGMLCRRLMEQNVSAVMDIGEMTPKNRRQFVANFLNTMVDLPRELWRPCFVAIDEVHEFAPNTKDKEYVSGEAIDLLFSKGRKRGFCPIVATQRLANVSPNVTAEAKNRFIGQTGYDVDQKRAADFLGWGKDKWPLLRDLSPPGHEGEFFGIGPALTTRGIVKFRGDVVKSHHPKPGEGKQAEPPQPSKKISAVLTELADLPKQAAEERATVESLKSDNADLRRQLSAKPAPVADAGALDRAANSARQPLLQRIVRLTAGLENAMKLLSQIESTTLGDIAIDPAAITRIVDRATGDIVDLVKKQVDLKEKDLTKLKTEAKRAIAGLQILIGDAAAVPAGAPIKSAMSAPALKVVTRRLPSDLPSGDDAELSGPERKVVDALAFWESIGVATPNDTAVSVKAGYTPGSSAYEKPRGSLRAKGLIVFPDPKSDARQLTDAGRAVANWPESGGTLAELHKQVTDILAGPEAKVLQALITAYPNAVTNIDLATQAGYTPGSSAYEKPRGRLRAFGLAEFRDGGVAATAILFPEGLK